MNSEPRGANLEEKHFVLLIAVGAALMAAMPAIIGYLHTPSGGQYLGYQYNTDDQMVYSAWMRQAMDGRLLMDNRFTTDTQPGLTVNIYFFVLGLIAKLLGIPLVVSVARIGFGIGFVFLVHRLVIRLDATYFARKLAVALAIFGGGVGFLVWQSFGRELDPKVPQFLNRMMLGRQPTDIWQPEGFVFPSMLTNSLFMVSLCLILLVFLSVLAGQRSWGRIGIGACAALLLMNIHSYDMLLIGLVLVGLLAMEVSRKAMSLAWFGRSAVVIVAAAPAALWFVYVLANDPVFRARAATETYSPNFRQILFGYLPMMVLGFGALAARPFASQAERVRRICGSFLALAVFGAFLFASKDAGDGYFLSPAVWGGSFVAMLVALVLLADENPAWNLVASWALIGTVAIYFPGLFQRKLAMGLSVPWAILAALAIAYLGRNQERNPRNLATAMFIILFSASSLRWLLRETDYIRWNVSSTTLQPVFLNPDTVHILDRLNDIPDRKVVLAPPGVAAGQRDMATNEAIPNSFASPIVPDLNPIVSGLSGSYTYAGHWSETPDYDQRNRELRQIYYGSTPGDQRLALMRSTGAQYLIAPVPEAFPDLNLFDFRVAGKVLVDGNQFRLIQVGG